MPAKHGYLGGAMISKNVQRSISVMNITFEVALCRGSLAVDLCNKAEFLFAKDQNEVF